MPQCASYVAISSVSSREGTTAGEEVTPTLRCKHVFDGYVLCVCVMNRLCGHVFCGGCSAKFVNVPSHGVARSCDICYLAVHTGIFLIVIVISYLRHNHHLLLRHNHHLLLCDTITISFYDSQCTGKLALADIALIDDPTRK
jgi:hypothetical protein